MGASNLVDNENFSKLNEYLAGSWRLSESWQTYIRTFITNLAQVPSTLLNQSTLEKVVYEHLRNEQPLESNHTDEIGFPPQELTDQRLLAEVCIQVGDYERALNIISQYPSLQNV